MEFYQQQKKEEVTLENQQKQSKAKQKKNYFKHSHSTWHDITHAHESFINLQL